jgi:hypothetical protein
VRIRFIPPARRELLVEAKYYDAELRGLGDAFLDEIARALKLIKAHPEASLSMMSRGHAAFG